MNTARITTLLGLLLVVRLRHAQLSTPKCDGYSKRPLNRSMWDWDASKTEADKQQSSLNDGSKIVLAFADQTVEPTVHTAAFAGFDEAASHTACQGVRGMVTTDSLKDYFDKARRFDQDRMVSAERSKRLAWFVAAVASVLACVSVTAVVALTPLKTVEPFVIRVDNSTGIVDVVSAMSLAAGSYDEEVTKYFAARYAPARVTYGRRRRRISALHL